MRWLGRTSWAVLGVAWAAAAGSADAQVPGYPAVNRPPVSPYINLLRGGNPALNYYGLVRPQVEFRNSIAGLQQQVGTIDSTLYASPEGTAAGFPTTGHPVQFGNTLQYFSGSPSRGGGLGTGLPGGRPSGLAAGGSPGLLGGGTTPPGLTQPQVQPMTQPPRR